MDGPGWTFIRTFNKNKDGRGAVMALRHSDAHSELEECDESMPESRKVSIFLDGISCPRLATGKDIIEGDPTKSASFQST